MLLVKSGVVLRRKVAFASFVSGLASVFLVGCNQVAERSELTLTSTAIPATTSLSQAATNAVAQRNLGQVLFFDPILSLNQNQSCSTCHSPSAAFSDPEHTSVSVGSVMTETGGRNTPTIAYMKFSPAFGLDGDLQPHGGQFWDGRASTLDEQASGPIFNAVEMALPSVDVLRERLLSRPDYVASFKQLFGNDVFDDADGLVERVSQSLAAFERSETFAPFDSKYDRFLRGELTLTPQEELGRTLFFSQQFTNCNQCHQLAKSSRSKNEIFTDFSYHNIGVPANPVLNIEADLGLAANSQFDQTLAPERSRNQHSHAGKFKVPTLRNVALTAPYMHNGVFQDLKTVVQFYNKYNSKAALAKGNPETGNPWAEPEVTDNIAFEELNSGPALDDQRVDALVAFLHTLTDETYLKNAGQ